MIVVCRGKQDNRLYLVMFHRNVFPVKVSQRLYTSVTDSWTLIGVPEDKTIAKTLDEKFFLLYILHADKEAMILTELVEIATK